MLIIRHILQWIINRAKFLSLAVLLGITVIFIWFFVGDNSSTELLAIKIASISALFAAVSSVATLIQAVEAQKQRQSLERPYIIADFTVASDGKICFVTQNIGNSPALNVSIKFSDPVPLDFAKKPLGFIEPIKFLPPGKSVTQLMGHGHSLLKDDQPTRFRFRVIYTSTYHDLFQESVEQDLSYLKGVIFPEKSVQESLENISRQLGSLVLHFSSSRGLWSPPPIEHSLDSISKELKEINTKISPNASISLWKVITNFFQKKPRTSK